MRNFIPVVVAAVFAIVVSKWVPVLGLLAIPLYIGLKRLLKEDE